MQTTPNPLLPGRANRYGFSVIQKLQEAWLRAQPRVGTIWMGHGVAASTTELHRPSLDVTLGTLRAAILRRLHDGEMFLPVGHLTYSPPKDAYYLTFDDGLASFAENAYPFLHAQGVPFCLFIPTGTIGSRGHMDRRAVTELAQDPLCTIGSHSVTHPLFRYQSQEVARRELRDSRRALEDLTGLPVHDFAFPYGSRLACSKSSISLAEQYYQRTYSTLHSHLNVGSVKRPRFLPRVNFCQRNHAVETMWSP